jgi:hypothetical protein
MRRKTAAVAGAALPKSHGRRFTLAAVFVSRSCLDSTCRGVVGEEVVYASREQHDVNQH